MKKKRKSRIVVLVRYRYSHTRRVIVERNEECLTCQMKSNDEYRNKQREKNEIFWPVTLTRQLSFIVKKKTKVRFSQIWRFSSEYTDAHTDTYMYREFNWLQYIEWQERKKEKRGNIEYIVFETWNEEEEEKVLDLICFLSLLWKESITFDHHQHLELHYEHSHYHRACRLSIMSNCLVIVA